MSVRKRIRFVAHAHAPVAAAAGVFECVADNSLDALARVDVLLRGDFVSSSLLEKTAYSGVKALGIFADHAELNIFFSAVLERRELLINEHARALVRVEVELE